MLITRMRQWIDDVYWSTTKTAKDIPRSAKVVDTYKGCDIVEWKYGPLAEYHYFLHCNNTRPVYEK